MDEILVRDTQGILSLKISRPERKNAITEEMMDMFRFQFEAVAARSDIRAVVISAQGPDFSAGGDLKNVVAVLDQAAAERTAHFENVMRSKTIPMFMAMMRVPQPILLAARGHVIGAAVQLAAIADLVVAAETVRFSLPQVHLAHMLDHGESWTLPRKIGIGRAARMCLLGERLDAAEALKSGLVNWVVVDSALDERAESLAAKLVNSPPLALNGIKALLRSSETNNFSEQFDMETQMLGKAVATTDFVEAIRAFVEKRPAAFTGR